MNTTQVHPTPRRRRSSKPPYLKIIAVLRGGDKVKSGNDKREGFFSLRGLKKRKYLWAIIINLLLVIIGVMGIYFVGTEINNYNNNIIDLTSSLKEIVEISITGKIDSAITAQPVASPFQEELSSKNETIFLDPKGDYGYTGSIYFPLLVKTTAKNDSIQIETRMKYDAEGRSRPTETEYIQIDTSQILYGDFHPAPYKKEFASRGEAILIAAFFQGDTCFHLYSFNSMEYSEFSHGYNLSYQEVLSYFTAND